MTGTLHVQHLLFVCLYDNYLILNGIIQVAHALETT